MPDSPHSVNVEAQIMNRVQDLRQHFIRCIKMPQIGPGVSAADPAIAVGVERTLILRKTGLFDRDFAFGGKKQAVAGGAGGQHAIKEVDAPG